MKITEELLDKRISFYSNKINELNRQPNNQENRRLKSEYDEKLDFVIMLNEILFLDSNV